MDEEITAEEVRLGNHKAANALFMSAKEGFFGPIVLVNMKLATNPFTAQELAKTMLESQKKIISEIHQLGEDKVLEALRLLTLNFFKEEKLLKYCFDDFDVTEDADVSFKFYGSPNEPRLLTHFAFIVSSVD